MSTNRVIIFDTTLRDGEQAAGTRLGAREKLEIARQLARLNVDIIEAGFPASSPEDFKAVQLICEKIRTVTVCGLTRARAEDIDICGKAIAKAKRSRIHTGIGVSNITTLSFFIVLSPKSALSGFTVFCHPFSALKPVRITLFARKIQEFCVKNRV